MNDLLTLAFHGHTIRTVIIDGAPWFVAADVCRALGLDNPSYVTKRLLPDEKGSFKLPHQRGSSPTIISEAGLYRLVNRSDKAQARPFQDWVNREVLPAIRKDGGYVLGEEKVRTGEMSEDELVFRAMEVMKRKLERLSAENEKMKDELEVVTLDEFRSLNHAYWAQAVKVKVAKLATGIARTRGITLSKQARTLPVTGREVFANVYPRPILAEACDLLGIKAA